MELIYRRDLFESNGDFQKLVRLQNEVYKEAGHFFTIPGFKFWYIDNPFGRVISFNAYDGEEMVAHYACIPTSMVIDGRIVKGIHSMATVTHPNYRGMGLFKTLAAMTYECAKNEGYEYVIGVANANSFPGFIKHLGFSFVSQLDVKWGWGKVINTSRDKLVYKNWDSESLNWRLGKPKYSRKNCYAYGMHSVKFGIKTMMGQFNGELLKNTNIPISNNFIRPLNLYVGLGADLSQGHYFNFPKFVKHSPFNLIFLDLTGGRLPAINKDNIFFQLIDFDVA